LKKFFGKHIRKRSDSQSYYISTGSVTIHDVIDESSATTSSAAYCSNVSTASRDVIGSAVAGRAQDICADWQHDVEGPRTDALPMEFSSGSGVKKRQNVVHCRTVPAHVADLLRRGIT